MSHFHCQIVGVGLMGVFELINETRSSHPTLCKRALQALLNMLQGQVPEGLKAEPQEVMGENNYLQATLSQIAHRLKYISHFAFIQNLAFLIIELIIPKYRIMYVEINQIKSFRHQHNVLIVVTKATPIYILNIMYSCNRLLQHVLNDC